MKKQRKKPNKAKPIIQAMVNKSETIEVKNSGECPIDHSEYKLGAASDNDFISYTLGFDPSITRPAPAFREFMDNTSNKFAYRCLPLNIANQYGWEILSPCTFDAVWNGEDGVNAVSIEIIEEGWPHPISHFGSGTITFHINQLFRTPKGMQLMVTGPMNRPKDGISALSGIIETDWAHYTFTMNWKITRAFWPIRFEKGEPIAHIMPVNIGALEALNPKYIPIESEKDLHSAYLNFQNGRNEFNEALDDPESQAAKEKWQKGYFRGYAGDGCPVKGFDHHTKINVKPFPGTKKTK